MKTVTPQPPGDSSEEIAALIELLHKTGQRLEQLTGGEVDSVANRTGQPFLLQHAQERLRLNEAVREAAILNALPANIALLDTQGLIVLVNEAWRRFGDANAAHGPGHEVGINYLAVCDKAEGEDAFEAQQAKEGFVSCRAYAPLRSEPTGRRQQLDDFLLMEDVRGDTSGLRTKDRFLRHFGIRLELLQVAGEMANLCQTGGPGGWRVTLPPVLSRPIHHEISCQWPTVMPVGDIPDESGQQRIP
ncbi:MAG: PAS domain-containing protein [Thiobacillus sp.]